VHLLVAVAPWQPWGFKFDHSEEECNAMLRDANSGLCKLVNAKKLIQLHDPSSTFQTSKHFQYDTAAKVHSCITKFKDGSKQINYLDVKTFFEHPSVEPIVTNPALCASITYVRTFESGEEISEQTPSIDRDHMDYDGMAQAIPPAYGE